MATKYSLKQIEDTIAFLGEMTPEDRQKFVAGVDSLKGLRGEALHERISKATAIQYGLIAAKVVY